MKEQEIEDIIEQCYQKIAKSKKDPRDVTTLIFKVAYDIGFIAGKAKNITEKDIDKLEKYIPRKGPNVFSTYSELIRKKIK